MKLTLSSQAKEDGERVTTGRQDNICIGVRQKQEVGCIIRGIIIFILHQMLFAVMGLMKMTKGDQVCSDKIRNAYTTVLEQPEGQVT